MGSAEAIDQGLTFTQLITPYLPLITAIAGSIIIGIVTLWNRKRGAVETRAPDVNEIWQQQASDSKALDFERKLRRRLEDVVYDILNVFKGYVNRVLKGGSVDLNTRELELYKTKYTDLVKSEEE